MEGGDTASDLSSITSFISDNREPFQGLYAASPPPLVMLVWLVARVSFETRLREMSRAVINPAVESPSFRDNISAALGR